MSRYAAISAIAGLADFLIALVLLHAGMTPWLALGIAIAVSGVGHYWALERWWIRGRPGKFSTRRLVESGGVELGTYLLRLVFLWLWKRHFNDHLPTEHFAGLVFAFAVAAVFGYLARTRLVFGRPKPSPKNAPKIT